MSNTALSPIFVGGCVRSGTTMLGAMIGAHPQCLCVPESQFKEDLIQSFDRPIAQVSPLEVLRFIEATRRFQIWELPLDLSRLSDSDFADSYRSVIDWLVREYGRVQGKVHFKFWVDHTPSNIRFGHTLVEHFPEAKLIHIVRDGRAVASSLLPLDWGPNTIDKAAYAWMQGMSIGLAAEKFWESDRMIRVRYEDLVRDPDSTLENICKFLKIDYRPEMAEGNGFSVPKYTAKQHSLVGRRPDPTRVEGWKKSLTSRQIEIYESIAAELLYYLGYELCFGWRARKITRMERRLGVIREFCRKKIANRFRLRRRSLGNLRFHEMTGDRDVVRNLLQRGVRGFVEGHFERPRL